jgi:hypothetical protein
MDTLQQQAIQYTVNHAYKGIKKTEIFISFSHVSIKHRCLLVNEQNIAQYMPHVRYFNPDHKLTSQGTYT